MEHPLNRTLPQGVITLGAEQLSQENPYKPGRVSPHTVYKSELFRVTELAFDDGVVLSEHSSPNPLILQVASGVVEVQVGEQVHRLGTGAMLHFRPGEEHAVTALEQSRLLLIFLQ